MLMYKQGRFWAEGASFAIPDGFFVEMDPDVNYERGIGAWDPSCTILYMWNICKEDDGAKQMLESVVKDYQPLSKITPIVLNGLSGYWGIYGGKSFQNYEVRFDLKNGWQMTLIVENNKYDIREVMASPEFKSALEGIRAEQT